jgi:hypothetical protein
MPIRSLVLAGLLLLAPVATEAHADEVRTALHRRSRGRPGHRVHTVRGHVHRHGCCRYVAGHHVTRVHRVVVPGHHVERVVPARFEVHWSSRHRAYVRVQVRARQVIRTWVPERVEHRRRRVWIPGRWVCR